MRSACSASAALRAHEARRTSPPVSSIIAHSSPRHVVGEVDRAAARRPARRQPERVGQPPGRVDRDDDDPPAAPGRLEAEHRRRRGLADAARAAAHDDRRRRRARRSSESASSRQRPSSADAATRRPARRRVGGRGRPTGSSGRCHWPSGRLAAEPARSGSSCIARRSRAERGRRARRTSASRTRRAAERRQSSDRARRSPTSTPLTTTGPSRTPTRSSRAYGGLDHLVDRRRLGQRDEHDLAAVGVGEQLEHVVGLGVDRPAAHGVEQPGGRRRNVIGVPGGRAVDDDEVALAAALELLDLAEHDDVVDARGRGGDDVDDAGRRSGAWRPGRSRARGGTPRAPPAPADRLARRCRRRGRPAPACRRARRPARAARRRRPRRARTAVTVVLPTPPLPATITTWRRQRRHGRTSLSALAIDAISGGTFAQTSDRPADAPRPASPSLRRRRTPAPRRTSRRPASGPVDVLQVSGLFDPIVVDAIERRHRPRRRRRRAGADPAGQQPGRGGRSTTRWQALLERIADAPVPIGRLGRPVGRPPVRHAGPAAGRRRRHRAWRPARASATPASPLEPERRDDRLRRGRRSRCAAARSGCPTPASLGVFDQRVVPTRGSPTILNMVDALDGYEEDGVVLRDDREP